MKIDCLHKKITGANDKNELVFTKAFDEVELKMSLEKFMNAGYSDWRLFEIILDTFGDAGTAYQIVARLYNEAYKGKPYAIK